MVEIQKLTRRQPEVFEAWRAKLKWSNTLWSHEQYINTQHHNIQYFNTQYNNIQYSNAVGYTFLTSLQRFSRTQASGSPTLIEPPDLVL